jgi:hypothetical protein
MAFEGHETRRRGLAGIGSKDFRRIRSSNGTEEQSIGCETLLAPAFVKHACAIDCPQRGERGLCSAWDRFRPRLFAARGRAATKAALTKTRGAGFQA